MGKRRQVYNTPRKFTAVVDYKQHSIPQEQTEFPLNFIKTSKYNMFNFLPQSLLIQFYRYANIYFLVVAILQSIPQISPLTPWSAIAPLVFVLSVSMIREGFEDYYRHKSDDELNSTPCTLFRDGKQFKTTWAHIEVGDLCLVKEDESFPSDLLVITTSYDNGACYIETGALDGEKNLKPKGALNETKNLIKIDGPHNPNLDIIVNGEPPNMDLYRFEGSFDMQGKKVSVGAQQLLLRGAFLRNTEWIIGVTVYSGLDTKIMRNAEAARVKQSYMEETMNKYILYILGTQILLAAITSIICYSWGYRNWDSKTGAIRHWYLQDRDDISLNAFLQFFTYFILYNTMIPISLIVSMEMVKVSQCYFIANDADLYHEGRQWPAKVSTTTINEELGQVEYVFSDQTGTLTCNVMLFKMCIIGKELYGQEEEGAKQKEKTKQPVAPGEHSLTEFIFDDSRLDDILEGQNDFPVDLTLTSVDGGVQHNIKTQKDLAFEYWTLLGGAHECIVQKKDKTQPGDDLSNIQYQGPSPDEITLVDAAMHMGFAFIGASASTVDMKNRNQKESLELIQAFQFDSARKRMSVIVQHKGVYKMLIKGADNIIKLRLSQKDQPFLANINQLLSEFSKIGLRTLMMAMKVMSENEVKQFIETQNRLADSPNREAEMTQLADSIETELFLIGATAVQDKLQDKVPEVIADLLRANLQVWMLTGDKLETAQNIAKSCKLIQPDMGLITVQTQTEEELQTQMWQAEQKFLELMAEKKRKAFLVEGEALAVIFQSKQLNEKFVEMTKDCQSVVCCRVTPKQKAQVVRCIQNGLNKICLAIGDGANDVNMIQEAHIGVGIFGNEGMRAVQASDFAFVEFKGLWRLLLVHGRWSYIRISEMIIYFFYKNMMFTIPQFYFALFSAYSGQTVFDDWYVTLYNLIFTALPLIAKAVLDQDVNYQLTPKQQAAKIYPTSDFDLSQKQEDYLRNKLPLLYYVGQKKTLFTTGIFVNYLIQGIVHGALLFFGCFFIFDREIMVKTGNSAGMWDFSITAYTIIVLLADLKLAIGTRFWTVLNVFTLIITSIGLYYLFVVVSHYLESSYAFGIAIDLMATSYYWLCVFLLVGMVFAFDMCVIMIVKISEHKIDDVLRRFMKIVPPQEPSQLPDELNQVSSFYQVQKQPQKYQEKSKPFINLNFSNISPDHSSAELNSSQQHILDDRINKNAQTINKEFQEVTDDIIKM